jgi:hypothetical protein
MTSGGSFMIDLTAPSVPASLTKTVTGNNVAFDWADATDATSGVKQYSIRWTTIQTFPAMNRLINNGVTGIADNYFWRVRTQDNISDYSVWISEAFLWWTLLLHQFQPTPIVIGVMLLLVG